MFLDDKLYLIGKQNKTDKSIHQLHTIEEMLKECLRRLPQTEKTDIVLTEFKRINNSWILAIRRLAKEGKSFISEDAFKKFTIMKFSMTAKKLKWND